jgi:hypothetical protein
LDCLKEKGSCSGLRPIFLSDQHDFAPFIATEILTKLCTYVPIRWHSQFKIIHEISTVIFNFWVTFLIPLKWTNTHTRIKTTQPFQRHDVPHINNTQEARIITHHGLQLSNVFGQSYNPWYEIPGALDGWLLSVELLHKTCCCFSWRLYVYLYFNQIRLYRLNKTTACKIRQINVKYCITSCYSIEIFTNKISFINVCTIMKVNK